MEKKIYYSLAAISTITSIITSIVLIFLFYDFDASILDIKHSLIGVLPFIAGILVFIFISLHLASSILTSKLIDPIKLTSKNIESILSGDNISDIKTYEELEPFIKAIDFQRKEIEYSIEKLKEAEKYRREFTADVSHELKTPLTSIIGFAEMMESGISKGEDIKKSASIIHKEGTRLLTLIDSIIKLSELDDLSIKKDLKEVDLFSISEYVYLNMLNLCEEKDVALSLRGESTIIKANKRMIEDLIFNLVDNAVKYNKPRGKVDIEILSSDEWATIRVKDTGIGISTEDQNRIFERFYRVDKSRSKKTGGTGLGLSIVKHIVEYHCGNLSIHSILGEGTDIEIKLDI